MIRLRRLLVLIGLSGALLPGTAVAAGHLSAYSLQPTFMCVSCHEPLNQVSSPEAQAEKQTLAQLVNRGLTLPQIKTQMVSDYGEQVLAQPPAQGLDLLVYILPPLVLVLGLGLLAYNLPRWRRRSRAAAMVELSSEVWQLSPSDAARLDAELQSFDR
ncbi:cytochrome c-type biogenesis protein CcmH [Conexibacter sp. DBS9H8]|uniref:cytochrome c-type biogenesis protein CcmH n=1 Tax=Conexibacter sp. DBS9H8 TaxID=2937801 RepID=UPI00200C3687|nr:cytochrome c-type biogenesis protein CcmH [Conexibacter sp. DBS9H8]